MGERGRLGRVPDAFTVHGKGRGDTCWGGLPIFRVVEGADMRSQGEKAVVRDRGVVMLRDELQKMFLLGLQCVAWAGCSLPTPVHIYLSRIAQLSTLE